MKQLHKSSQIGLKGKLPLLKKITNPSQTLPKRLEKETPSLQRTDASVLRKTFLKKMIEVTLLSKWTLFTSYQTPISTVLKMWLPFSQNMLGLFYLSKVNTPIWILGWLQPTWNPRSKKPLG